MKQRRKPNTKPIEIKVARRVDAGVSDIAQICQINTHMEKIGRYRKSLEM